MMNVSKKSRLTQVGNQFRTGKGSKSAAVFECSCDNRRVVLIVANVKNGHTLSCGCVSRDVVTERNYRHGKSKTNTYNVYRTMRARCENVRTKAYSQYGGRGITVCERWKSFEAFFGDMGDANGMTLDRVDVNGPYSPENCRWTSWKVQQRNRRNNRLLTFDGITMCSAEWADKTGLSQSMINLRLKRGWTIEQTLTVQKGTRLRSVSDGR